MSVKEYTDLGRFDIENVAIPSNGVVKHLIETHNICTDVDLNTNHRVYELRFEETTRPIDIRSSYIRLEGKVGATEEGVFKGINQFVPAGDMQTILSPGWIYNAFEEMALLIDNQGIETVREPRATMMMKAHLQHDWEGLTSDVYASSCLFDREMGVTYDDVAKPGVYSKANRTHMINADGTFEFMIPLALIFETIRTLPAHYMHLLPVIQLKRAAATSVGIFVSNDGDNDSADKTLIPEINFSKIELVYNEIVFNDGIDSRRVEQQYYAPSIVSIHHRKWDSQTITYDTGRLNTKLTLTPSKHGNSAMIIAWYQDYPPAQLAILDCGYQQERLKISSVEASYGGVKVCNYQRLDDDATNSPNTYSEFDEGEGALPYCPNVKRVYEDFKKNLSLTYSDSSLAMDYETFRLRHPYIFVDMSKFNLGGDGEVARMLHISVNHNLTKKYKMIVWLLSNEVTILNPRNGDLLVTGGL